MNKLNDISRSSILQATLVCKQWQILSQALIYRDLDLVLSPGTSDINHDLFQRLDASAELRQMIRHVHIRQWIRSKDHESIHGTEDSPIKETAAEQFEHLRRLIPELSLLSFT